jgi:hypothetical protein
MTKLIPYIIIPVLLLQVTLSSVAQVGINTNTPASSALLEVSSTSKGFLPPRMTKAQRDALSNTTSGMIVYCTDCDYSAGCVSLFDQYQWYCINDIITDPSGNNYLPVTCGESRIWLDRNLGAYRVAQSLTDYRAYGSLFQWGRPADGHEKMTWSGTNSGLKVHGSTTTISTTDVPGHNLTITSTNPTYYDWHVPQNNNLWQGKNGINNPCPAGYRLPTSAEFSEESGNWASLNSAGAASSPCRFPVAGDYNGVSFTPELMGEEGHFWTSTIAPGNILSVAFKVTSTAAVTENRGRVMNFSVRCIKD